MSLVFYMNFCFLFSFCFVVGWSVAKTAEGITFYQNNIDKTTTSWTRPVASTPTTPLVPKAEKVYARSDTSGASSSFHGSAASDGGEPLPNGMSLVIFLSLPEGCFDNL